MNDRTSPAIKRFNYLTAEINAAYHDAALAMGLSDSAMMILYTLYDGGGRCLLSDIPRFTGISKQTVNSALRKLEAQGAVRLESAQGRNKAVCLTESGKTLAEETAGPLMALENAIFDSWSPEDRERYLTLTQRYLEEFRALSKEHLRRKP